MGRRKGALIALGAISLFILGLGNFGSKKEELDIIKIGAVMPLTGDLATYGIPIKNGMRITKKGINKRKVGVISIKNNSSRSNSKK